MTSILNRLAMKCIGKLESVQPVIPARYGVHAVGTEKDFPAGSASGLEPVKEIAHGQNNDDAVMRTAGIQNQQAPKIRIALNNIELHGARMERKTVPVPARRVSLDEFLERKREAHV